MDPLTAGVMTILGKYAIDAGATLLKEAGPAAKETAASLFRKVMDHLRQKPAAEAIADGYEKNPKGYEVPMQDQVNTAVSTEPAFKAELQSLLEQYQSQAQTYQSIQAQVGSGAAAIGDGATAVGERGVIVHGNVSGNIIIGDSNQVDAGGGSAAGIGSAISPTLAAMRDRLDRYFDRGELETLCFDLGIDDQNLRGETKVQLAQSLAVHCDRNGRLDELRQRCQSLRPHVAW